MKFEMLQKKIKILNFFLLGLLGMVQWLAGQPEAIFLVVSDPSMNEL
jgi:hypothetical protein